MPDIHRKACAAQPFRHVECGGDRAHWPTPIFAPVAGHQQPQPTARRRARNRPKPVDDREQGIDPGIAVTKKTQGEIEAAICEGIARFEQERQALAMMDHPNIAKVLDAGAENKQP